MVNSGFHSVEDLKQIEAGDLEGIPGLEENEATILTAANGEAATEQAGEEAEAEATTEAIEEPPAEAATEEESAEDTPTEESAPESEEAAE